MAKYFAGAAGVTTGTAKKTLLQMLAGAQRNGLYEATISFRGVSGIAQPVLVTVERQTTAGTGGANLATNWGPNPIDPASPASVSTFLQGPAAAVWTAEPTSAEVLAAIEIHPQSGVIYQIPLGDEIVVNAAGRIAIVCTAAAAVAATATMRWREGI
ncbi:hypothetical protein [Streptosporangium lutulentum]|uniref:Phage tail protein n=1 Tax=Streptosporangium lutulentum TaxID=1461250 RepID=A0ABT9Q955_9ACTN|nr:hypothetical protein [Streptosporangium lutulentum]MDP9843268.1 hypothetical protein [Streptosporangium lutulentum]